MKRKYFQRVIKEKLKNYLLFIVSNGAISVGLPSNSSAQYYVKDPSEIHQFLKIIKKRV